MMQLKEEEREKREYLPRRRRVDDPSQLPYEETDFDRLLLELLAAHHMLAMGHFMALTRDKYQHCALRLKKLYHRRYVGRHWLGKRPIYFLERKGAEAIAAYTTADIVPGLPKHAIHDLMIANFHVCLTVALRDIEDAELEARPYQKLFYETQGREKWIVPDRVFIVCAGEEESAFAFEANYQLRLEPFLAKMRHYWTYAVEQRGQKRDLDFEGLRVLNVAKTERKAENLRMKAREADPEQKGSSLFWVTSEERYGIERPGAVLEAIWQTAKDDSWHSLLEG